MTHTVPDAVAGLLALRPIIGVWQRRTLIGCALAPSPYLLSQGS